MISDEEVQESDFVAMLIDGDESFACYSPTMTAHTTTTPTSTITSKYNHVFSIQLAGCNQTYDISIALEALLLDRHYEDDVEDAGKL